MNKREYAKANLEWLAEKAKEEGVKSLPRGIYYKVLSEGNADGKHPTPRSIVTAHYTGRTINGKKFDSSRGGAPLAVRLCDLIEGWIADVRGRQVGGLHPCRNGLRQILATRNTRRLNTHFRNRTPGNCLEG